MNQEILEQRKQQIAREFGEWVSPVRLGDAFYTNDDRSALETYSIRIRRILSIASDLLGKPLASCRVADLGSLEGAFAIEFASQGARTVAIEGRRQSFEKIVFAKDALALKNMDVYLDDARQFNSKKYGSFDLILCLGLLYHLDYDDVFSICRNMYEACERLLILDTHVASVADSVQTFDGKSYWGETFNEADPNNSTVYHSIGNPQSFVLTPGSLRNLLVNVGFHSIYQCQAPLDIAFAGPPALPRLTLAAVKRQEQELLSLPPVRVSPADEQHSSPVRVFRDVIPVGIRRGVGSLLPAHLTVAIRRLLAG